MNNAVQVNDEEIKLEAVPSFSSDSSFSTNNSSLTDKHSLEKKDNFLTITNNNKPPQVSGSNSYDMITNESGQLAKKANIYCNLSTNSCNSINQINLQLSGTKSNLNLKETSNVSCNSSINRRLMLNSISKLFRHRRKIMTRANSLKKSIKQVLQLADKKNTWNSMVNNANPNKLSLTVIQIFYVMIFYDHLTLIKLIKRSTVNRFTILNQT